jgi:hypothetical protein
MEGSHRASLLPFGIKNALEARSPHSPGTPRWSRIKLGRRVVEKKGKATGANLEPVFKQPRTTAHLQIYCEIMPTAASHVSTSCGHRVMGDSVGRSPNAWPPFPYKCISAGTPAFRSAE